MPIDVDGLTDEQISEIVHSPKFADVLRLQSPWMTPAEAAAYLGIALGTLRNWTSSRFIPFSKRGRIVRYHRETLDKWLARGGCPGRASLADLCAVSLRLDSPSPAAGPQSVSAQTRSLMEKIHEEQ